MNNARKPTALVIDARDPHRARVETYGVAVHRACAAECPRCGERMWGPRFFAKYYFVTGIGAGVVLFAAASLKERIGALVCRDGRPDTALFRAASVSAPALFLVEQDGWPYREVYDALVEPDGTGVPLPNEKFYVPGSLLEARVDPLREVALAVEQADPGPHHDHAGHGLE